MTDAFEISKKMADLAGDQGQLSKLILETDIDNWMVFEIAVSAFEITSGNVKENIDAARKLCEKHGQRINTAIKFRVEVIRKLLKEIDNK